MNTGKYFILVGIKGLKDLAHMPRYDENYWEPWKKTVMLFVVLNC